MRTVTEIGCALLHSKKAQGYLSAYLSDPFADLVGLVVVPSASWGNLLLVGDYPDIGDVTLTWSDLVEDGLSPQTLVVADFYDKTTGDPHRLVLVEHQSALMSVLGRFKVVCYSLY